MIIFLEVTLYFILLRIQIPSYYSVYILFLTVIWTKLFLYKLCIQKLVACSPPPDFLMSFTNGNQTSQDGEQKGEGGRGRDLILFWGLPTFGFDIQGNTRKLSFKICQKSCTYIVLGSKLLKSFALLIKVRQAYFTQKSLRGVFELLSSFFQGGIQTLGAFRTHSH